MQSQSLLKNTINISIFTKVLTDDIFEDMRFVQLMNLLIKKKNVHQYTYCVYCDSNLIKTNIFIPIFHTMYLSCQNNNVLIKDQNDLWLADIFKNNQYYVLKNQEDEFDYSNTPIKTINDIKELL